MSEVDPYGPPSGPSTPRTKKTAFVLASDMIWLWGSVVVSGVFQDAMGGVYAKVEGGASWLPDIIECQCIPLVRFQVRYDAGVGGGVVVIPQLPYEPVPELQHCWNQCKVLAPQVLSDAGEA